MPSDPLQRKNLNNSSWLEIRSRLLLMATKRVDAGMRTGGGESCVPI